MAGQPSSDSSPPDIFISYQSEDSEFAARLAAAIETDGDGALRTFFAPWDIRPGQNIVRELDNGLSRARHFGLILSPAYLNADWTTGEGAAAVYADPAGRFGRVIPIMHRKCQLPPMLRFRKYVDIEDLGFDLGVAQIVAVLRGLPMPRGKQPSRVTLDPLLPPTNLETGRAQTDAVQPDTLPDLLYPNIFPVVNPPSVIWAAPTNIKTRGDLFKYYGPEREVPPFILADGSLFTFANLSRHGHPFTGVVEDYDVSNDSWGSWASDLEGSKRLTWLLDDCLRQRTRELRMRYERRGKKYYYEKGALKEQRFKAFARGSGKDLVIDYTEKPKPGNFIAHRAVNLRFLLVGTSPFLRVESGWVFTNVLGEVIEGRRRTVLNSRFTSGQRNSANFNEVRFWVWFLAGDEPHLRLRIDTGVTMDVRVEPEPVEVGFGILGDNKALSPIQAAPEIHFEEEDEGEGPDDGESLEAFDEDEQT